MSAKEFIEEFKARGFFYQATDEKNLINALDSGAAPSAYIGFDCTAKSLHVGNLMQIMILRLLQKHNIRPIVLVGGGTTKVGDPSFKDTARKLLADEEIQANIQGIKKSLTKFIKFDELRDSRLPAKIASDGLMLGARSFDIREDSSTGTTKRDAAEVAFSRDSSAMLLNNDSWLSSLNYLEFLRDYGKHFSVNRMISFESVKIRLDREQSLSFLEFNYMILQAYDFYYLNDNYNCVLQCGGSDQWGNIINGVELIRRLNGKEAFGLTTPLITTASGGKMGKTEQGAIWLNEEMLSPYNYYQFWRNVDDLDVFRFMRLYTDLALSEIEKHEQDKTTNINAFKKILAYEATKLCHGEELAAKAHQTAIDAFEKGNMENIESITMPQSVFEDGIFLYELFKISGLSTSNSEAKRLIIGGGAKLHSQKIEDENYKVCMSDLKNNSLILSSGKKRYIKISVI